jgi:uncharacterized protein YndB with AHSA1/START domain
MTHPNLLAIDRSFSAPPAFVFGLWSHPSLVSAWWGPEEHHLQTCEIDFRPGGNWRFNMAKRGEDHWVHGTYHEIVAHERLLFSYRFPMFAVQSIVSLRFTAEGQGTRMQFLQTGFPNDEHVTGHNGGWNSTFSILEGLLLRLHGIGSVYPALPPAKVGGVAADLAEARKRHDAERVSAAPAP